jgi:hypothetical protein
MTALAMTSAKENALELDGPHSQFLRGILKKESWSRAELVCVAADCQVLLEGAIDTLNDAALNCYDDLLIEGDDPVTMNPVIARELKNEYH